MCGNESASGDIWVSAHYTHTRVCVCLHTYTYIRMYIKYLYVQHPIHYTYVRMYIYIKGYYCIVITHAVYVRT